MKCNFLVINNYSSLMNALYALNADKVAKIYNIKF